MNPKWRPGGALGRARSCWSPWRIATLPLGLGCAVAIFLFSSRATLRGQLLFGPDRVFFCTPTHLSMIILFLVLSIVSIPIGFAIANLLLWMVPPIRTALEQAEARAGRSFATANREIARFTFVSGLVLLPVYVMAFGPKVCLAHSQLSYQSHTFASPQTYNLTELSEVRPRCTRGSRGGWDIGLDLVLSDGTSFDLAVVGPWFSASSDSILALLRGLRLNDSEIDAGCPLGLRKLVSP